MKAGFARLDITPPFGYGLVGYFHKRPADGIITPLYVNAVVIDDGERRAALVTLDAEGATANMTRIMREYTAEMTGMDPDSIFISCTHSHTAIGIYSMDNPFHHIFLHSSTSLKMTKVLTTRSRQTLMVTKVISKPIQLLPSARWNSTMNRVSLLN